MAIDPFNIFRDRKKSSTPTAGTQLANTLFSKAKSGIGGFFGSAFSKPAQGSTLSSGQSNPIFNNQGGGGFKIPSLGGQAPTLPTLGPINKPVASGGQSTLSDDQMNALLATRKDKVAAGEGNPVVQAPAQPTTQPNTFTTPSGAVVDAQGNIISGGSTGVMGGATETPTTGEPAPVAPPETFTAPEVDPELKKFRDQLLATFDKSPEETELLNRLNQMITGGELGSEAIRTQPIPTPFLRGQEAALQRQLGIKTAPLQRQLGILQEGRETAQEKAETQLGFKESDIAAGKPEGTSTFVNEAGETILFDSATGEEIKNLGKGFQEEGAEGFTLSPGQVRFDADGNVIASGGPKPASDAQIAKALEKTEADQAALDTQIQTVSIINSILTDPNLGYVTGKSRIWGQNRTGTATVRNLLKQFSALTAIGEREKLKGSGTISDFEAKMLGDSASALNGAIDPDSGVVKMGDKEVVQALKNIRGILIARTGQRMDVIAEDLSGGEPKIMRNLTFADMQEAFLQGFIIDFI